MDLKRNENNEIEEIKKGEVEKVKNRKNKGRYTFILISSYCTEVEQFRNIFKILLAKLVAQNVRPKMTSNLSFNFYIITRRGEEVVFRG